MRKNLPTCLFLLFFSAGLRAQYPDLSTFTIQSAGTTAFNYHCTDWENLSGCNNEAEKMAVEVPPWIIGGGGNWRSYFMNDGKGSSVCSAPYDIIGNSAIDIKNTGTGPFVASSAYIQEVCQAGDDWKRNYYGIYSAQYFNHPAAGTVSLGFLHGENRNMNVSGALCPNTINQNYQYVAPGDFLSYNGVVSAAWVPNIQATNWGQQVFANELGPIAWPSTGYLQQSGEKATAGLRHPSSVIYNNYVYVFYLDTGPYGGLNPANDEGRRGGIKVVRAPLNDALNPYAYQAYYRDPNGNESWNASLPPGFTKETMLQYLKATGPMTTGMTGDGTPGTPNAGWSEVRFSVAQVRNTNYFMAVEEYTDNTNTDHVAIWFSNPDDLVHWNNPFVIYTGSFGGGWAGGNMHYPIFLGSDGWSNTSVDQNDFYVLGTGTSITNIVNKMHIYLPAPPPPPPPPCGSPGADPCGFPCPNDPNSMCITRAGRIVAVSGPGVVLDVSAPGSGVSPNPGHGVYQLNYTITRSSTIQLNVLDATGKAIRAGNPASRTPGHYQENIDISAAAKGVYLVELLVDGGRKTFKVIYE